MYVAIHTIRLYCSLVQLGVLCGCNSPWCVWPAPCQCLHRWTAVTCNMTHARINTIHCHCTLSILWLTSNKESGQQNVVWTTNSQTDRHRYGHTDIQTQIWTHRQTDRQTHRYKLTDRQTQTWTHRQTDTYTQIQTDRHTHTHTIYKYLELYSC